jgi:tetratricopeptide (TPR) repeat protein
MAAGAVVPRVLALVLSVLVFATGMAEARPKTDPKLAREAKKHLKAGLKHEKRGKLDKAIEELQIAYSLDPDPGVLFHLAEAHNAKKEYKEALYYYRQYQKEDPKGAKKREVAAIIDALAAMEQEAGQKPEAAPPADKQPPPAEAAPPAPEPAPVPEPAPGPDLTARAPEEGGGGGGLRVSAYIAAGAGVVLLGTGGYFAWVAHKREGELSDLFDGEGQWSPDYQDKWDQGESARTKAIWLSAAGGAALATGVVLYLLDRRSERSVEVGAVPHAGGGEVMARWAF